MPRAPRHVAIIMDGNGRWATERGLPRMAGHKAGVDAVENVVAAALDLGIETLTLYVFSQENWKRPKEEVTVLMGLLDLFLKEQVKKLISRGVKLQTIGRIEALAPKTLEMLKAAVAATSANDKLNLNVAINYGGRTEILDAVGKILEEAKTDPAWRDGRKKLDEETFSSYLYTAGQPDPDLLIRTSGEMRLSNFLLWQLSYSEIYITRKYWPDFGRADFEKALEEYAQRERRFGDVHAA